MLDNFFHFLTVIDEFFWGYIAFFVIFVLGLFLTIKARFFQIRALPNTIKTFIYYLGKAEEGKRGVHPLKAFFASTGGMIGIGNVVGVVTAVQLGGPGALLWVWIAGMIGAIVKYCEIYLGFKFRVENASGSYDGGPMYFLKKAFKSPFFPIAVAFLLCLYGAEIYQFTVIANSISTNWHLSKLLVIGLLLLAVLYATIGGVRRIGQICSLVMPIFLLVYCAMGLWVIGSEIHLLPHIIKEIFWSAFTGHAAVGGFAGASVILAIQNGLARAAYSADIGVGYDSIIQSESSISHPERQARLAIFGVMIDNLICTLSILVVLFSGAWMAPASTEGSFVIESALGGYFPYMEIFMPVFYIVTGYTTIIAYLVVGVKCATYLAPKYGRKVYLIYASVAFVAFSFLPQSNAMLVMSICGAMLLVINLFAIFRLRGEISYSFVDEFQPTAVKEVA